MAESRILASKPRWPRYGSLAVAVVICLMLLTLAALLAQQRHSADLQEREVDASRDRHEVMTQVLTSLQDIETGQRGYLLSGEAVFLEPYERGRAALASSLKQLERARGDHAESAPTVARVTQFARAKAAFAAEAIKTYRAGEREAAIARVSAGRGKILMDEIRKDIAWLQEKEKAQLAQKERAFRQATARSRQVANAMLIMLALMLAGAGWVAARMLRERHRALDQLQDASRRSAAILSSAMDAILTVNPSGSIETANAAATRMFGYSADEMVRRDAGMLQDEPPPIGAIAATLAEMDLGEEGPGLIIPMMARRKDGSTFPAEIAIAEMPLQDGKHYVAIIRDMTERKRIEQMKTEFVSTVSHELRTPLTSIAGSLGLLAGGAAGEMSERAKRLIDIARTNAERLVRLINDVLDIEKIESGTMSFQTQPLLLGELLHRVIEANRGFAHGFKVDMQLEEAGQDIRVSGDADRLEQVFTNLLSNAIKFSPAGGIVRIAVQPGEVTHTVSFSDQGPGIPVDFQSRIFGKFAQADASDSRQKGGTGLGLSIVKEIVDRHGGSVGFETEPDRGTTFWVRLPALRDLPQTLPRRDENVLICADLPLVANQIAAPLRERGRQVAIAGSEAEVREAIAASRFDVVLVHMGMSEGAAIPVVRMIRDSAGHHATPILAIGADGRAGDLHADAAQVIDWMEKPLPIDRLLDAVETSLSQVSGSLPRILHVDDDPDVLDIVVAILEGRSEVTSVRSLGEARRAVAAARFDLVILDLALADGSGVELLPLLRTPSGLPLPVVIFSAQDSDPSVAASVDAFLTKSRTPLSRLVETVEVLSRGGAASSGSAPR